MPVLGDLLAFCLVALALVLSPGPVSVHVALRSACQGRRAGLVALGGVALGYLAYLLCAVLGLGAALLAVPGALGALRAMGVAFLLWLAWRALRPAPGAGAGALQPERARRIVATGFLVSLLNPGVALLYLSLLPQFVDAGRGAVASQAAALGAAPVAISVVVNGALALAAAPASRVLDRPRLRGARRWGTAAAFAALALGLAASG